MRDEDLPTPPPLPASHPTQRSRWQDSLRIPGIFYFEVVIAQLLVVAVASLLARFVPSMDRAALLLSPVLWLFCFWRLLKRVVDAQKAKGRPRWSATLVFVLALLLPIFGIVWFGRSILNQEGGRSQQSEAKIALRAVFESEKAFHSEMGRFTFNTRELALSGSDRQRYLIGFATACSVKAGVAPEKAQWSAEDPTYLQGRKLEIDGYFLSARHPEDCKDPKEGFEAFAVGTIKEEAPLDVWSINEKRELKNLQRGF